MKDDEVLTVKIDTDKELIFNYTGNVDQFFKVIEVMIEGLAYTLMKKEPILNVRDDINTKTALAVCEGLYQAGKKILNERRESRG